MFNIFSLIGFQFTNKKYGQITITIDQATMNKLCTSEEISNLTEKDYCLKVDYHRSRSTAPYLGISTTGNPATDSAPSNSLNGQYSKAIKLRCQTNTVSNPAETHTSKQRP